MASCKQQAGGATTYWSALRHPQATGGEKAIPTCSGIVPRGTLPSSKLAPLMHKTAPVERIVHARRIHALKRKAVDLHAQRSGTLGVMVHVKHCGGKQKRIVRQLNKGKAQVRASLVAQRLGSSALCGGGAASSCGMPTVMACQRNPGQDHSGSCL